MTLRRYITGMFVSTLFCWISWGLILIYLDPEHAGFLGFLCFYLSLFFACIGSFTLLGFYSRVFLSRNEVVFSHIGSSFRQAILLSLFSTGGLLLQSVQMLNWWTAPLFFLLIFLLEFFFIARRRMQTNG